MSDGQTPSSGHLAGDEHIYPVRVYYEDTDAGGIVYHANYLRYCERARTELMRLCGVSHSELVAMTGVAFAVRRCEIDFRQPARLDDALEVVTRIVDIGGATLDALQTVRRSVQSGSPAVGPAPATGLVSVRLTLCCIDRKGRPVRLPGAVRAALARFNAPPSVM